MTNPYYTKTFNAIPLTVIPSSAHNAQYALVEVGFDAVDVDIQALDLLKAPLASPAFTGVPTVPTAAVGTSTTQAASTEHVQQAVAAVNSQTALALSVDSAAAITAVAGQHIVVTNASAVTVTLPAAPTAGDVVWVGVGNERTDNVIARNGLLIMGLAEDMTINNANATVSLRYISAGLGWRII